MKILIFGDMCPTKNNQIDFEGGNNKKIFGKINNLITESDISIVNLECPLTNSETKLFKSGPNLKASKNSINAIKNAGFSIISLANNHILDYSKEGLLDTIKICNENNIETLGAGNDKCNASKFIIKNINGVKIGIMAFADNEYNIAENKNAGANGLDLLYSFDEIKSTKLLCDHLIILYHSGLEHYQYPSPQLQRRCRKMVESGADLVTCQHSHCIGAIEEYLQSTIVYGQGNFLFSTNNSTRLWNTGLLISIDIEHGKMINNFTPLISNNGVVEIADEKTSRDILLELAKRSDEIKKENFIKTNFNNLCQKKGYLYWSILFGFPRLLHIANRLSRNAIIKILVRRKKSIIIGNIIQCETHKEVLSNILARYNKI